MKAAFKTLTEMQTYLTEKGICNQTAVHCKICRNRYKPNSMYHCQRVDMGKMTVQKALRVYTDLLLENEPVQIEQFKDLIFPEDWDDFVEEAETVNLLRRAATGKLPVD